MSEVKEKKQVLTRTMAVKEVNKWLDGRKYGKLKREEHEDSIDAIAVALCEGELVLKTDGTFEQTLLWPIGNDESIKKLTYKTRCTSGEVEPKLARVKGNNFQGILTAYISVLTNEPVAIIKNMESVDRSTAQSIATFFL